MRCLIYSPRVRTLRVAGHPNVEFSGRALRNGTVVQHKQRDCKLTA
jgi:hypothetical protein